MLTTQSATTSTNIKWFEQGIIDQTETETFAKGTQVHKIIAEAKVHCFGDFAAGQHVNECFFANMDVFFYWLAYI